MDDVQTVAWTQKEQLRPSSDGPNYGGLFAGYEQRDGWDVPLVLRSDLESLAKRVRELEGDAARYRWLRERAESSDLFAGELVDVLINGDWQDGPGMLDTAIDSAMQQDGGGREG